MELRGNRAKATFARFLGIPAPMYHRYERGQVPKEKNLQVLAERCGVTVDWLLGRSVNSVQTGTPKSANAGGYRCTSPLPAPPAGGTAAFLSEGDGKPESPHMSRVKPASSNISATAGPDSVARDPIDPYVCRFPGQIPEECRGLAARIAGVEGQLDQIRQVLVSLLAQERVTGAVAPDKRAAG
jgi:hypothetical protein